MNRQSGVGNGIDFDTLNRVQIACREDLHFLIRSLATHEQFNDFTGVTERHAYRRQYSTTSSFAFYVDTNYDSITSF